MNDDNDLSAALLRLATLRREGVDRLALREAAAQAQAGGGDARAQLARLAGHLGLQAPLWLAEADPARVPALALSPTGQWHVLLGQDAQGRWVLQGWSGGPGQPGAQAQQGPQGQWQEQALPALDGWQLAVLKLLPPFAVGRSPAFALVRAEMLRRRRLLLEAALGGLLIGLIGLVASFYSMHVYNRVIPTGAMQTLWVLTGGALLATLLDWVARGARSRLYEELIDGVDQRLARTVYLRLLSLRLDQLPGSVGSLASQLRGYETVRSFLAQGTGTVLVDLPFAALFLACLAFIGGALVLVPLLFFGLSLALALWMRARMEAAAKEGARSSNLKTGLLVETVEGAETIKSGQAGWRMLSRWLQHTEAARRAELDSRRLAEHFQHLMSAFQQLSYVLLVAAGAWLVGQGRLTTGALVACTILAGRVLSPMALLANQLLQWSHTRAALEGLDVLWRLEDDHQGQEPVLLERLRGHYRLEGVVARYAAAPALKVAQLEIRAGERVGVIGPIGAGKTTLLRLLSGMYRPQEGRVLLDDVDLAHIAKPVLAEHMGYLQQEGRLFAGTLRENLLLGLADPGDEAVLDAARRTGLLQAVVAPHPRGLQQPIQEGGSGLSGGQRQLVNLTRVVLRRPRLWLLDEPTAALDGNTERQVIELLRREPAPDATLVLVTHKPELLQLVGRLIVVAGHQIVADGPTAQVLARLQMPAAPAASAPGPAAPSLPPAVSRQPSVAP